MKSGKDNSAQTALQKGLFELLVRPEWPSDCGRFAKSFGPNEKIDGADGANEVDGIRMGNGRGENACKAFSKDLGLYDKSVLKILVTR